MNGNYNQQPQQGYNQQQTQRTNSHSRTIITMVVGIKGINHQNF